MNIEPGTRVRFTDKKFPSLIGTEGLYVGPSYPYHVIHWDEESLDWDDLHTEEEFEVIDE